MREVRECDFCGANATGVYDVLPSEVGERRVLLCDGCRETLTSVVDPLVEALDGGAGADPSVERADDEGVATSDPDPDAGGGSAGATGAAAGDGGARAADAAGSGGSGSRGKRTRKGAPRGYRKVLRFLENREFPMDRAEAESMAADAYDLDTGQVADVIDHAIKHDRLREASGELRR
ncbi:MAG: hypothetical protein ABEI11_03050 [Haloarculaceae archaeon]